MTRGRRPVPTHLQLLRGNPGRRALPESEPEPGKSAQIPEAPAFLLGYACDEWYRIAEELHRLNLLTVVDINPLAAYCDAYARWRTAVEALADMAKCDPVLSGLMTETRNGTPIQNPIVVTAAKAANDNGPLCRRIWTHPIRQSTDCRRALWRRWRAQQVLGTPTFSTRSGVTADVPASLARLP